MKTSRNDPCPCGSGKKYKACCMKTDVARERAAALVGDDAFEGVGAAARDVARQEEEWAADLAPAVRYAGDEPDAAPSLVLVMAGDSVIHAERLAHRPAGAAERGRDIAAAVLAAGRTLGVLPRRLEVEDREVAEEVDRSLAGRGVSVVAQDSESLWEAMESALANLDPSPMRGRIVITETWRETEATAEELAGFHHAAAEFYLATPWSSERTSGPFLIHFPNGHRWAGVVMGDRARQYGLALYAQPSDLWEIDHASSAEDGLNRMIGFSLVVDFDERGELTRTMQREIAAAGWRVAGPAAYPRLFGMMLPGRRVLGRDVRLATQALRAVAVYARGEVPLAQMDVGVVPYDPDDEGDRVDWFHVPPQARPICPEGPGANPAAGLRSWDSDEQSVAAEAAEKERLGRFTAWLAEQELSDGEREADLLNAELWTNFLGRVLPAGAVTEFDFRLFVYRHHPWEAEKRMPGVPVGASRALPRSMHRITRWLEEWEGIRYPFAACVLDELEAAEQRGREMGEPLEGTLYALSLDVYSDLDARAMLPTTEIPGVEEGWPDFMRDEVPMLHDELQRRWLLWYDELVRGGLTDYGELREALVARQREWETTPHPQVGGRTPVDVVTDARERRWK